MHNSFHGRTMATISATGSPKAHQGFEPLLSGFKHIAFNDIEALKSSVNTIENIVAIMIEPIQGEGGIVIPNKNYLKTIRSICDKNNLLMIVDEVQTGMCRTGKWFAFQHERILPDIMTIAKALGNGVPIGACLARGKCAKFFQAGSHGSTFGGNPLACAVAIASLDVVKEEKLAENAYRLGQLFRSEI